MVAIKVPDVDRYIARPDPSRPVILVYGPDAGLVHERAHKLINGFVEDPADPFQLARLEGDELAGTPTRLVEEANTVPLFGGRRAVLVRTGTRSFVPAVEALLAASSPDCRVVIEAGQLRGNAPLRVVCERARNAVALPCYPDNEDALGHLIDAEMREHGLSISQDARAALVPLLGGDRLASRHELEKLALFARGRGRVELADIAAVTADASALELDSLIDAAFAGRTPEIEFNMAKARTAGTSPGSIIFAALRQVAQLHKARLAIEAGNSIERAVQGMYAHFTRKELLEAALRIWTSGRLERAMSQLADAALEARKQTALADAIAERALLALAVSARRKQ